MHQHNFSLPCCQPVAEEASTTGAPFVPNLLKPKVVFTFFCFAVIPAPVALMGHNVVAIGIRGSFVIVFLVPFCRWRHGETGPALR
jgi:hypothetical protein